MLFIIEQINKYRKSKLTISMIKLVKYTERIIPLLEYNYINEKIILFDRINPQESVDLSDSPTEQTTEQPTYTDSTSKNLFILLCKMRERDMQPGIIFDITDDIVWRSYFDLINYIV